jgi:trk system potassium uptake protein TrkA
MKFCIIGLDAFGQQLAKTISQNGGDILAVDQSEDKINAIQQYVSQAICTTITDKTSLQQIAIEEMDVVIVAVGRDFDQSILICTLLKHYVQTGKVIAKAITEIQRDALKLIGVDEIVCPEIQTATQLADSLYSEFSNLVRLDPQFAIGTIKAPHDFIDKTVHEIQLYEQFKINCIAIKRDDEYITAHPQHIILEDDELVVAGKYNKLRAIIAE